MWQLSGCLLFLPISELIYFGIYETCCTQYLKLWKEPALYWSQFTSALCCYFLIYFYTVSHLLILFICMPKRKERERGRERITLQRIVAQRLSATILSQTLAPSFCFLCQPSLCCILHPALLQKLFLTLSWVSPTFCSLKLFCGTISTSITEKKTPFAVKIKDFLKIEDLPRRLPRTWIYWTKLTSKATAGVQLFQYSADGKWFCCSVTRCLHSWSFLSINFIAGFSQ